MLRHFLSREFISYFFIGVLQFILDVGVFFLLLNSLMVDAASANIFSRASAATIGFVLNRCLTFAKSGSQLKGSFIRYWCWWLTATMIGSVVLKYCETMLSDGLWVTFVKVAVECCLVGATFLVFKFWVYR